MRRSDKPVDSRSRPVVGELPSCSLRVFQSISRKLKSAREVKGRGRDRASKEVVQLGRVESTGCSSFGGSQVFAQMRVGMSWRFGLLPLRCVKGTTFPLQINYTKIKANSKLTTDLSLHLSLYAYCDVSWLRYQNNNQPMNPLTFLLAISLIFSFAFSFSADRLPYQAHSFNDLGIARQMLHKRVRVFKFDASLADRSSCEKYSSWDRKSPCFNSSLYSEEVCCIAMRGDAGSQNNFNHPFSTSDDFVALFQQFLGQYGADIKFLFASINFQYGFELNNPITENFLYKLSILLKQYKGFRISVEEDFILSYDKICQKATDKQLMIAGEGCTLTRKAIADSSIVLQSGSMHPQDSRDHKLRYRNFNIYYKQIDRLCRDGFPTWQNKYPEYPLIFWEPSNEDQIQTSLRKLFASSCASKHNRSVEGIAFASNIDPEMFAIFMKETNLNELKNQFPWQHSTRKVYIENAQSVKMATLNGVSSNEGTASTNQRLVVYWQRKEDTTLKNYLSVYAYNEQKDEIIIQKTIAIDYEILELHAVKNTIIAFTKNEQTETRDYNATAITLNAKLEQLKTRVIVSYLISYADSESIYYIARTSNPNYFNLYALSLDLANSTQYGVSTYMNKEQLDKISAIYFKKAEKIDDDVFLVFGYTWDQTWMAQIRYGNIHKQKMLTFGTNANIIDNDGSVFISLENSYSHSGILLNNNAENKCMLHKKEASARLARLPYLVNLLQAKFDNLMAFLNDDSDEVITACNPNFTFSKYMNGARVEIASAWGLTFLASKYVPLNALDFMGAIFSGGSNYQPSLRNKTGFLLTTVNSNRGYASTLALEEE